MFEKQYYYLIAGLKDIFLDDKKQLPSILSFKEELKEQLTEKDYSTIKNLYFHFDNKNIINHLFSKDEFNSFGNFSKENYENLLKNDEVFPAYIREFLSFYKENKEQKDKKIFENYLTNNFYRHLEQEENLFVKNYYSFIQNLENINTAIVCRKFDIPITNELIGKNELTEQLETNKQKDFGIARDYEFTDELIKLNEDDNSFLTEKFIDKLKWDFLNDAVVYEYFSLNQIISYALKLQIIQRWEKIDKAENKALFEKLLNELQESVEIDDELE